MSERKVPEVRFRGFSGEWITDTLQNSLDVCSGQDYKHLLTGDIPVYGTGGYMLSVDKALSYKDDAIGIGRKGTINKPYLLNAPFWTVDTLFYAISKKQNDLYFLFCEMQKIDWKSKDESTGVPSLSRTTINAVEFTAPEIDEQAKIGELFKNLDELIAQNQKKYDKLVNMKKACLDKMFPKDGADTPELRFKGFSEKWEVFKLGDLGVCSGGTSIEAEFCSDGIYKVISIGSYSEYSTYREQGLRVKPNEKTLSRLLNKYDLTMVLNDKTASGRIIGRTLLIDANDSYVYNQRTQRIQPHHETFDAVFLYQMLNAPNIRNKIFKQSQGNTQIYVNWTGIENILYYIPEQAEQTKIGNFFQTLDNLITLQKTKLEKLKNIKKACLDKMFI